MAGKSSTADVQTEVPNKEVVVTWLSQEECIAGGAQDMDMILEYVDETDSFPNGYTVGDI